MGSDLLRSNPLSIVIMDRQARMLYAAIDGRKAVEALCIATQMSLEDATRALQILLSQRRIQLREPGGPIANSAQSFES